MMRQVEMRLYGTLARGSQTVGVPIFPKGSPFSRENGDPGSPFSWGSPKFYDTGAKSRFLWSWVGCFRPQCEQRGGRNVLFRAFSFERKKATSLFLVKVTEPACVLTKIRQT